MRFKTAAIATGMALALSGSAWAQAGAGSNNGSGTANSQEGTMNNPGRVNGKSEAGSSTAGVAMQKSDRGSMSTEDDAMKSGSANGQEPTPANPKPGQ